MCTKWRGQRWWHGFYGPKIFRPTLLAKAGALNPRQHQYLTKPNLNAKYFASY